MSDKEWAMQVIGMNAALYDSMMAEVNIAILDVPGSLYRNATEDIDSAFAILKERDREDAESAPEVNEGPVIMSCNTITSGHAREDVEARIAEMREAKILVGELADAFCDVGWRLPLAVVLSDVQKKEERIRLLTLFFNGC